LPARFCYRHGVRIAGLLVALSLVSTTARAERTPVVWLAGAMVGTSYADTTNQDARMNAGARLAVTFEDAPLALPPAGTFDHDARLVPELFAGFYANDERARSQLGAGVRAEMQFARNQANGAFFHMRAAIYVAARAKITGPNHDSGAEFTIGEYLIGDRGHRFGWEGGLGILKRPELTGGQSPELEALVDVFVGF
jgi:hypothetical protein